MKYTDITKPGMGDPYWYEWSVGIKYIIDMLLPENGIKYVELQANVELGLDDVVVTYNDDNKRFIQVKHTRADNTLTFGNIVSTDKGDEDDHRKISLLNELAKSWSIEKSKYKDTIVCLYTNRKGGSRGSSTQGDNGHKRPPLIKFWQDLKTQLATVSTFEDISFPGYEDAWKEFIEQLSDIPCNKDKLLFLRSLEIDTDRSGLTALEHELINQIKSVFQTTENNAEVILSKFDHALRTWTTSTRETSHITAEDVMDMLSFKTHIEYYNHDLVPNEPFFRSRENLVQSIEKELQQSHEKVIFLSGIPGTGKTNIISKLSAKRNSLVDIRYYAYEPIDPAKEYHPMDVSKRVEKNSFWNEIFDQLRKKLKGQLYKYNVPIMNELMSLSQMKTRFFEIASNYAKDRGICFVIAIDGIDHAARALHFDETFLPDLPYPEYIPENIKIILAGQPKEGYSNYPSWLFSDKENVKQIEIPCIQTEDIQDLVNTHFQSLPNDKQQQMADIITKYADGNTLSAIFAVYEAEQQQDLIELEKRLINRKLSGNIQVYYNAIWKDATSKIGIPFIDYKIAGVLAFFNESLNDKKLASIFFEERIAPSTWKNVLKTLKPLLLEHDGNYTILHNDVRVFLSGMICVDQEHVKEVYGKLADYYLNMSQKEKAYYKDIYRFLKASERIEDFKLLFSPDYIIEAYVNGVGLDEINRIAQDLLRDIISKDAINWVSMRNLALSYLTINQIETSSYEIDGVGFRKEDPYIQYHPYECYVEDESSWGSDLILDVLSLSKRLYDHGYTDRAIQLFKRWFSDISISQFVSCIEAPEDDYGIHTSPQTKEIAKLCGECIVFTADFSLIQGCQEIEKEHYLFVQNVYDSILKTIITEWQGEKLSENLEKVDILYLDSLLFCTKHLLDNNRIADMAILEKAFHDRLTHNASGKLFSCFMRIISSNPEWTTEELNEIEAMINSIELTDSLEENDMLYCSIYSFVFSYSRISSSYEESAHIVLEKFMEKHKHLSRKYFGVYFTNICLIGKWIASVHKNMALYFRSDDIKHLLESLLFNKQNPSDGPLFTNTLHSILIKAYIFLSRNGNVQFKTVIDEVCDRAFSSFPINDLINAGFYYYKENLEMLQKWATFWLGIDGQAWKESIGDRNRIIHSMIGMKKLYDVKNAVDIASALERARWSVIGYSSHKEYACEYLLDWYNELVDQNEQYIDMFARKIKKVSDEVEVVGDNRIEHIINSKVFSDLFRQGYPTINALMHDNHYLSQCIEDPSYLVDGLIGMLKSGEYTKEKLLEIWSMGIAFLDWRDESQQATILSLQRAIELCAKRLRIESIYEELKEYGPAYIDQSYDCVRFFIPRRWCDIEKEYQHQDQNSSVIDDYISRGVGINADELVHLINKLKTKGEINDEKLAAVLSTELRKNEYSIARNPLVKYLVKALPMNLTDSIIKEYLNRIIEKDNYYLETDLPAFVLWQMNHMESSYGTEGMERLIQMHESWITTGGHFQHPDIEDTYCYTRLIEWKQVSSISSLFYQIIRIILQSEDADAVRTALGGLFALARTNSEYIAFIEKDWNSFHYRAKEWLCMIYELLWYYTPCNRELIQKCIENHCGDNDFNVALYANLLRENVLPEEISYIICEQSFFNLIPDAINRRLIKTEQKGPFIVGNDYVFRALSLFEAIFGESFSDIESRTASYLEAIEDDYTLIPLNRRRIGGYYKVDLNKTNIAFFRVMYKDWFYGRWAGLETYLGRILLSASEPYTLLITPKCWQFTNGFIIEDIESFVKKSHTIQNKKVEELLALGVNEDETVITGSINEFTHNQEIFGFSLCYADFPGIEIDAVKHAFEINSRILLQQKDAFIENDYLNMSLHYKGIESFQLSRIACGVSKTALDEMGWRINLSSRGFSIEDKTGKSIGRFEYFYGKKADSNRNICCQPVLQRWIIKKDELCKARLVLSGNPKLKMTVETVIMMQPYK